ncbi:MAG: FHA domain-containing serine/threonine-protein kinase [Anaerolineae bacterium]|nr:FHA domain-containing serine/threonine-protein kinase [Anaerolineae bacterium]
MEWVGRVLSGCQIVDKIGEGRMAVVYRAYQPHLERWVAVKILRVAEGEDREEFLRRFRQEARAIAALRHPNILTIYDYGEASGTAYIVMEYVPGGSLKARLTGHPIPWPEVAQWVIPVGQALAYAHAQGIVHRDVKPANILLARPDWPLLADFGLAKIIGRAGGITRPGVSVGTPAYFSPEQVMGEAVDHRTDIYSLGVVLYELLTGQLPFQAATPAEAMLRRLREPPIPPHCFCPSLSPALEAIILRALARNPADRYPTMQAMVDDLLRVSRALGVSPPTSPPPGVRETTVRLEHLRAVSGPRLCVVETGVMIPLPSSSEIVLGRSVPTSPSLPDVDLEPYGASMAGISRRHARLLRCPDGWFLEDLQSTNGTFVNEVRLLPGQPVRLNSGDLVRLGQFTLLFYPE